MANGGTPDEETGEQRLTLGLICLVFFLSGFPALIYQLIWQRSLFAIYGINIESVTVIVAAFMLGLGFGSLLGGAISKRSVPLLLVFGLVELGIGGFGLISLDLFAWVGSWTLELPLLATGLVTFALVLIPTLLMGATLPILVAYLVGQSGNVGRSLGLLYFVNTFGSAVACFVGVLALFPAGGQSGSIALAAGINLLVGTGAVVAHLAGLRRRVQDQQGAEPTPEGTAGMPFVLGLVLVFLCGLISLSYEIFWFRVYAFVSGGAAQAFGLLLGAFLYGIASGSAIARRFCHDGTRGLEARVPLAVFLGLANVLGFLVVPAIAGTVTVAGHLFTLVYVVVAAGMLGATFPLIAHLSVPSGPNAGARISYLYLANILGSATGSLVTGFLLMEWCSLRTTSLLLALLGLAVCAALFTPAGLPRRTRALGVGASAIAAVLVLALSGPLFGDLYERLLFKTGYEDAVADGVAPFKHVVENRSGVITVTQKDTIYGGGIYDGVFSIDLVDDRNLILRAYALSAFHPAPRKILMVGLSSGSWAQVVANHPQLERLVIVEISAGYLGLIERYPAVAPLLKNPKVEIVIDDGRRWLARHDERFDFIVMNTTFHWRAHATNLLSAEFHDLLKAHLLPGGVAYWNTTDSDRHMRTGALSFPDAVRIANFCAVSNRPMDIDRERWRRILTSYEIEGKPVLDLSQPAHRKRLEGILGMIDGLKMEAPERFDFESRAKILERTEGLEPVTDDNMGTEWDSAE